MDRLRREFELLDSEALSNTQSDSNKRHYDERIAALRKLTEATLSRATRELPEFQAILIKSLKLLLHATGAIDANFRLAAEDSATRIVKGLVPYFPTVITGILFVVLKDQSRSAVRKTTLKILSNICKHADPKIAMNFSTTLHVVLEESIQDQEEGVIEELDKSLQNLAPTFCFFMSESNIRKLFDILLIRFINVSEGKRVVIASCMKALLRHQNMFTTRDVIESLLNYMQEAESVSEPGIDKSIYMLTALHGCVIFMDFVADDQDMKTKSNSFQPFMHRIVKVCLSCLESSKNRDILQSSLELFCRIIPYYNENPFNWHFIDVLGEGNTVPSLLKNIHRMLFADAAIQITTINLALQCLSVVSKYYPEYVVKQFGFLTPSASDLVIVELNLPDFENHEDQSVRGFCATLAGSLVYGCLKANERSSLLLGKKYCIRNPIIKLSQFLEDSSGPTYKNAIAVLAVVFDLLINSDCSTYAVFLLRKVLRFQGDSYWLIKQEVLSLLEVINMGTVSFAEKYCSTTHTDQMTPMYGSPTISVNTQTMALEYVLAMLKDPERRVRTKAAQVLSTMLKSFCFSNTLAKDVFQYDLAFVLESQRESKWDSMISQKLFARSLPHVLPKLVQMFVSPAVESASGVIKALINLTDTCKSRLESDEADTMNLCGYFDVYAGDFCAHTLDWASSITDINFQIDIVKLLGNLSICSRNSYLQFSFHALMHVCRLLNVCNTILTGQPLQQKVQTGDKFSIGTPSNSKPAEGLKKEAPVAQGPPVFLFNFASLPFYVQIYNTLSNIRKPSLSSFEEDPLSLLCTTCLDSFLFILRRVRKDRWIHNLLDIHTLFRNLLPLYPESVIPVCNEFFHTVIVQSVTPSYYMSRPSIDIQSVALDEYTTDPMVQDQSAMTEADMAINFETDSRRYPLAEYASAITREQRSSSLSINRGDNTSATSRTPLDKIKPFLPTTKMMKYPGLILSRQHSDVLFKALHTNEFLPFIFDCMKMYKSSLNAKVKAVILDFLGRIVACGINFSQLDRDNTFLGFIIEQLTDVDIHMSNTKHLLGSFFEFLCILMFLNGHKQDVLTINRLTKLISMVESNGFLVGAGIQEHISPLLVYIYDNSKSFVSFIPMDTDQAAESVYKLIGSSLKKLPVLQLLFSTANRLRFTIFWKRYAQEIRERTLFTLCDSRPEALQLDEFPLSVFEFSTYIRILNRTAIEAQQCWDIYRHLISLATNYVRSPQSPQSPQSTKIGNSQYIQTRAKLQVVANLTRISVLLEHFCAVMNHRHTSLICPTSQEAGVREDLSKVFIPHVFVLMASVFETKDFGPYRSYILDVACSILECMSYVLSKYKTLSADATCTKFGEYTQAYIVNALKSPEEGAVKSIIMNVFQLPHVKCQASLLRLLFAAGCVYDLKYWVSLQNPDDTSFTGKVLHHASFLALSAIAKRVYETRIDLAQAKNLIDSLTALSPLTKHVLHNIKDLNVVSLVKYLKGVRGQEANFLINLDQYLASLGTCRPQLVPSVSALLQVLTPSMELLDVAARHLLKNPVARSLSIPLVVELVGQLASAKESIDFTPLSVESRRLLAKLSSTIPPSKSFEASKSLLAGLAQLEFPTSQADLNGQGKPLSCDFSLDNREGFVNLLTIKCAQDEQRPFSGLNNVFKHLTVEEIKSVVSHPNFNRGLVGKSFSFITSSHAHQMLFLESIARDVRSIKKTPPQTLKEIQSTVTSLREALATLKLEPTVIARVDGVLLLECCASLGIHFAQIAYLQLLQGDIAPSVIKLIVEYGSDMADHYIDRADSFAEDDVQSLRKSFLSLLESYVRLYELLFPSVRQYRRSTSALQIVSKLLVQKGHVWSESRHSFGSTSIEIAFRVMFAKIGRVYHDQAYEAWFSKETATEEDGQIDFQDPSPMSPKKQILEENDGSLILGVNIDTCDFIDASPSRTYTPIHGDQSFSDSILSSDAGYDDMMRPSSTVSLGVEESPTFNIDSGQFPPNLKYTSSDPYLVRDDVETLRELTFAVSSIGWSHTGTFQLLWDFYSGNIHQVADDPEEHFLIGLMQSTCILFQQTQLATPGSPESGFLYIPREHSSFNSSEKGKSLLETRSGVDRVARMLHSWRKNIPFHGNIERSDINGAYEANQVSVAELKRRMGSERATEVNMHTKILDNMISMFSHPKFLGRLHGAAQLDTEDEFSLELGENYKRPCLRKESVKTLVLLTDWMTIDQIENLLLLLDYIYCETRSTIRDDPLCKPWLVLGICKCVALLDNPPNTRTPVESLLRDLLSSPNLFAHVAAFDSIIYLFQASKQNILRNSISLIIERTRTILIKGTLLPSHQAGSSEGDNIARMFESKLGRRYYQKLLSVMYQVVLDFPRLAEEADFTRSLLSFSLNVASSVHVPCEILSLVYAGLERLMTSYTLAQSHRSAISTFACMRGQTPGGASRGRSYSANTMSLTQYQSDAQLTLVKMLPQSLEEMRRRFLKMSLLITAMYTGESRNFVDEGSEDAFNHTMYLDTTERIMDSFAKLWVRPTLETLLISRSLSHLLLDFFIPEQSLSLLYGEFLRQRGHPVLLGRVMFEVGRTLVAKGHHDRVVRWAAITIPSILMNSQVDRVVWSLTVMFLCASTKPHILALFTHISDRVVQDREIFLTAAIDFYSHHNLDETLRSDLRKDIQGRASAIPILSMLLELISEYEKQA
eukprot:TRINITY_DN2151_c0_g1_i5.p1 TRINITY_DN2151_c0_g1~~TRINITY_DN2151_c0_g1_i5.p1  ORF type:complete len:2684 (+),score=426.94 TRINITY_DN2151_c0_g1_i5:45-8096(+)